HLAGVDIETERRVGVEIVARAVFRIEHRRRLAGAPERQLEIWIIGAGLPEGPGTLLPGIVVVLPGFVARLARRRHAEGPPYDRPGISVESVDRGARTLVDAAAGDDQLVADHQRSAGQRAVAGLEIVEFDGLGHFAGVAIAPDDPAIAGNGNDKVLIQSDAAV